jgi:transposase
MESSASTTINTANTITIPLPEYESLKSENAELKQKVDWFMEQFRLSRRKQFGQSSEKSEYLQLNFFNEAEATADLDVAEPELTEIRRHYRKKAKEAPDRLPEDIPVETIIHDLPENDRVCPGCSGVMHVMGRDVFHRGLKLIPAQAVIAEHVRLIYSCRQCEKDADSVPIVKAPVDEPVIKGSFATPEAIAHIMTQKFEMGSPLYRQEQEWNRNGIMLSRQTMSNWLMRVSEDWLEPIYRVLHKILLQHDLLFADETTIQVLKEPDKPPDSDSFMWLYRTGGDTQNHVVLFEYQPDRKAKRPKEFLEGYKGYLHTDGYVCYHGLAKEIIIIGCLSHIRRKFVDALYAMKPADKIGTAALVGKEYCDRLFRIERELSGCTAEERFKFRQEKAAPVIKEFYDWLQAVNVSKKTMTGVAVTYARNQFKYFENYLLDGRLEISNSRSERSLKPFVINRKNFLFANTPGGAKSAAVIFSLIQTARENGLNAYDYLTYVFKKAPNLGIKDNPDALLQLLPWDSDVQDACRKLMPQKNENGRKEAV